MTRDAEALRAQVAAALRLVLSGVVDPPTVRRATDAVLPLLGVTSPTPDASLVRERHLRRRKEALALMAKYERAGNGRMAARLVAAALAADPRNPLEVETLAQQCRRWRRGDRARTVFALSQEK